MIDTIADALRALRLEVEEIDGLLNVSNGSGIMAAGANVDPGEFIAWLDGRERDARPRYVAGWAKGVKTVLLEPKRSDASDWTFVESAGSLLPSIEVDTFALGVRDASGGDPAWVNPLHDDLVIAWTMRLNRGIRPLTVGQFEGWSATADRVDSAGRSLLFHESRNVEWRPTDTVGVEEVRAGDGHDAARILVAEDVWFTRVDRGWRFAMPTPDVLLAAGSDDHVEALRAETQRRFDTADYPLTTHIWRMTADGPRPEEP